MYLGEFQEILFTNSQVPWANGRSMRDVHQYIVWSNHIGPQSLLTTNIPRYPRCPHVCMYHSPKRGAYNIFTDRRRSGIYRTYPRVCRCVRHAFDSHPHPQLPSMLYASACVVLFFRVSTGCPADFSTYRGICSRPVPDPLTYTECLSRTAACSNGMVHELWCLSAHCYTSVRQEFVYASGRWITTFGLETV